MSTVLVHHVEDGPADGPVLVLAHSLGTSLEMWQPQVPALARKWRTVRYDHRGHGHSPLPRGPYTIDDLGADVLALLDHIGVERASFCGSSLGGMVGLWLAAHAPERIDQLVVCCTSARPGPRDAWTERAETVRANGTVAVAESVHRWFTRGFAERNPGIVDRMSAQLAGTPDEGYASCCSAIAAMDLRPVLSRIKSPTLVIAGRQDEATPPHHARTIASHITGAEAIVVDDAAHLVSVEQPQVVTELLLDHLSRHLHQHA